MDFLKVVVCVILGSAHRSEGKLTHFHQTYPKGPGNELVYDFGYAIDGGSGGVVTNHWEENRGGVVRGAYSLLEPGGNVRTVDYQVSGGSGFRAVVRTSRPGFYFLSTQEFQKSNQIHLQPSPELEIPREIAGQGVPDEDPPVNYHAINAEVVGYQKLYGENVTPRTFLPPSRSRKSRQRTNVFGF